MATAPQRTASLWDGFYAHWVEPVLRFGTPALVVFVLLLLAVRVLSRVVVGSCDQSLSERWDGTYWIGIVGLAVAAIDASVTLPLSFDHSYDRAVQTMLWITIGLIVVCGFVVTALFARPARTRDLAVYGGAVFLAFILVGVALYFPDNWHEPIAVVVWGVLLAKLAAVVAARVRGLHIGLMIAGRNKDGADDAGLGEYVRVRLHALGSQPPRGIELSQATDVSSLPDGALNLLPAGTLAKLGALLVQLFQPATPWRVIVCEQVDSSISVVLLRNGKVAETVVIRRALLNLPAALKDPTGSNLALRTAAAAFVLLTLAERHPRLRRGLGGATDWRSVATQVIATDPAVTSADVKIELLSAAVAFDAGNLSAYAALVAVGYRHASTELDYENRLAGLLSRIERRADDADDLMAIRLRTLFNLSVVRLNRAVADPAARHEALTDADHSAAELTDLIEQARTRPELAELVAEVATAAWILRASIHALGVGPAPVGAEPSGGRSLVAYYESACLRMLQGRTAEALDDLLVATRDPIRRAAARTDDSFAVLHDQDRTALEYVTRFKQLVGDAAPVDLFDIASVKRHRKRMVRNGILTGEQLAAVSIEVLSDEVGIPIGEARMLHELALLAGVVKSAGVVFLLLHLHIPSRAELRRRLVSGPDLHSALIDVARDYTVVAPSSSTVLRWLTDLP